MGSKQENSSRNGVSVKQVDASLDQPLNKDAPPTIYGTTIKPELSTASLNLSIDFIKQQQSLANRAMIYHPITYTVLVIVSLIYLIPKMIIPRHLTSGSVAGFLYQLILFNRYQFGSGIAVISITFVCLLTTYSRISEIFFKSMVSEVTNQNGENVFGVDLKDMILKKEEALNNPQTKNTYIVVYRETPIALVSICENKPLTSKESLVMSISTLGSRKVYLDSGILEDLLDWTMIRTRTIAKEGNFGKSMKVLINVYSFDTQMKKTLKNKGFSMITSGKIKESKVIGGLFGLKKELWGVQFHFEQPKKE